MVEAAQTPKIPGYRIEALLARGGMASVYLATQKTLNRLVAVKVLAKRETPEFTERFQNESRLVASLNHANVITIHDLDVVEGSYFIAMEYLEGGDLKSRIAEGLDPDTVLEIVEQIAGCLQFVHERGIVHRDIKPANILFRSDGTPVLTDFGIAKHTTSDPEAALTETGTTLGTPYYMSPEQARGEALDGRADIYSLGIVFYEALTGKKPYKGSSNVSTMLMHVQEPIPRLPPQLAHLQGILDRMLAKEPRERFASAAELHEALRVIRGATSGTYSTARIPARAGGTPGDVTTGSMQGTAQQLSASRGKTARIVAAAAAASIILVVGVATWLWTDIVTQWPAIFGLSISRDASPDTASLGTNGSDPSLVTGGVAATGATAASPTEGVPDVLSTEASTAALDEPPAITTLDTANAEAPAKVIGQKPSRQNQIRDNLDKANLAVRQLHLSTPAGNNAWFYYQQVLAIDPDNPIAHRGINRLADLYAELVRKHMERGNQGKARRFVARGLSIKADHAELLALQQSLVATSTEQGELETIDGDKESPADFSLIENIREFFKKGEVKSPLEEEDY